MRQVTDLGTKLKDSEYETSLSAMLRGLTWPALVLALDPSVMVFLLCI